MAQIDEDFEDAKGLDPDAKEDPALKYAGDKLTMSEMIQHCTEDFADDYTTFYVEQAVAGEDNAVFRICGGMSDYCLTFLDSKALDRLSAFFASAAQKLRYCTKGE